MVDVKFNATGQWNQDLYVLNKLDDFIIFDAPFSVRKHIESSKEMKTK